MPWKIVPAAYDAFDPTTLHDDELIAMERTLAESLSNPAAQPGNETNPRWRAWQKIKRLAERCTGDGDPMHILPPGARASPVYADYVRPTTGGGDGEQRPVKAPTS